MENNRRAMIFIDGSNFYFKMKSLGIKNLRKYNYRHLCEELSGKRKIISVGYYVGVVRAMQNDEKGQKLRINQIRLFNHLRSPKQKVMVHRGYLMKNDGVYHEKGVDVKIATDLLVGAYENLYDDAIVISSDTDFCPVIRDIKERDKIEVILYTYFDKKRHSKFSLSNELISCCSKYVRLLKSHFDKAIKKTI